MRQWRERVRTAHPLSGEKFEGDVLFMDRAPGVSLEKLTRSPPDKPTVSGATVDPPAHLRLVRDALAAADSRKIVRAALFDFLFGQCDRHAQNVFWTVEGDFAFIDNDQALGRGWKACVANSFLIPGSEKFTIARFGNTHVNGDAPPIKTPTRRSCWTTGATPASAARSATRFRRRSRSAQRGSTRTRTTCTKCGRRSGSPPPRTPSLS